MERVEGGFGVRSHGLAVRPVVHDPHAAAAASDAGSSVDTFESGAAAPPARAIAIACGASVAVAMAADMGGTRNSLPASDVVVLTSEGSTSLQPGTTSKSSKVSASAPAKISSFIR